MIGIAALVVGIALGLVFPPSVPEVIQPYLPIAVVAALDAGRLLGLAAEKQLRHIAPCLARSGTSWSHRLSVHHRFILDNDSVHLRK